VPFTRWRVHHLSKGLGGTAFGVNVRCSNSWGSGERLGARASPLHVAIIPSASVSVLASEPCTGMHRASSKDYIDWFVAAGILAGWGRFVRVIYWRSRVEDIQPFTFLRLALHTIMIKVHRLCTCFCATTVRLVGWSCQWTCNMYTRHHDTVEGMLNLEPLATCIMLHGGRRRCSYCMNQMSTPHPLQPI